tara:strand:- start:415 stop:678 length:264 start_codon:yes stop_codon:yes gene_type:complete
MGKPNETRVFGDLTPVFGALHFFQKNALTCETGRAYKPLIDGSGAAGEPDGSSQRLPQTPRKWFFRLRSELQNGWRSGNAFSPDDRT